MNKLSIQEALQKLGNTSQEVADSLARKGIRGHQGVPSCCPVAKYLRQECNDHRITVGAYGAGINTTDGDDVDMPLHVRKFVLDFDNGIYPNLIQGSE